MIWLLGELLVYLVVAAAVGFTAGWMLRGIRTLEVHERAEGRFRQMLGSAELERDAARIRVRELGYQLDAMDDRIEVLLGEAATPSVPSGPYNDVVPLGSATPAEASLPVEVPGPTETAQPIEAVLPIDDAPLTEAVPTDAPPTDAVTAAKPGGGETFLDPDDSGWRVPNSSATTRAEEVYESQTPWGKPQQGDEAVLDPEVEAAAMWKEALDKPISPWKARDEPVVAEVPGVQTPPPLPLGTPERPPGGPIVESVSEPAAVPGPEPTAPPVAAGDPVTSVSDLTLETIPGLPADIRGSLESMEVRTCSELARRTRSTADLDQLAGALGVQPRLVRRWGGMADLMQVPGVGADEARLLEAAGLGSVAELSIEEAGELAKIMSELNQDQNLGLPTPSSSAVKSWIRSASEMAEALQTT